MEKLLLTVREAADVLSVSRSRVYELIYAEQLDSVKIGRSRRVSLASVRRLGEGPSAPSALAALRVKARFTGCRTAAGAGLWTSAGMTASGGGSTSRAVRRRRWCASFVGCDGDSWAFTDQRDDEHIQPCHAGLVAGRGGAGGGLAVRGHS